MKILEKLKIFGKKKTLNVSEDVQLHLKFFVNENKPTFEALKEFMYSEMSILSRELVTAPLEEVKGIQKSIKVIDNLVKKLETVGKLDVEEQDEQFQNVPYDKNLILSLLDQKPVAKKAKKPNNIHDYMASKDFNGTL